MGTLGILCFCMWRGGSTQHPVRGPRTSHSEPLSGKPTEIWPLTTLWQAAPTVRPLHSYLYFFYTEGLETQDFKALFTNMFDRVLTKHWKMRTTFLPNTEVWEWQQQQFTLWQSLWLCKNTYNVTLTWGNRNLTLYLLHPWYPLHHRKQVNIILVEL